MWLEDVLYGALASGVNAATVVLLNVALIGCIISLAFALLLSYNSNPALTPHIVVLLILASGLLLLINWFLLQIGTVRVADQQKQLFGDTAAEPQVDTPAAASSGTKKAL